MFSVLNIVVERGESDSTLAGNSGKDEPPQAKPRRLKLCPLKARVRARSETI